MIGIGIALVAAALGAGVMIGRATEETTSAPEPLGLAPASVVALVDAGVVAWNSGDLGDVEQAYAEDATFDDAIAGELSDGRDAIAQIAASYAAGNVDLSRTSEVFAQGEYAANAFTYNGGYGIAVYEIRDGQIARQWVMGA